MMTGDDGVNLCERQLPLVDESRECSHRYYNMGYLTAIRIEIESSGGHLSIELEHQNGPTDGLL